MASTKELHVTSASSGKKREKREIERERERERERQRGREGDNDGTRESHPRIVKHGTAGQLQQHLEATP